MILFFDTETTGFTKGNDMHSEQPGIVQLGLLFQDDGGPVPTDLSYASLILTPTVEITEGAEKVHGISSETAMKGGIMELSGLSLFMEMANRAHTIVAHNLDFDIKIMAIAAWRYGAGDALGQILNNTKGYCTMKSATDICRLPNIKQPNRGGYKWPKLEEAIKFFFDEELKGAHDAMVDTRACARVYWAIQERLRMN